MESTILYLIPALGIFGLVVMVFKSAWVTKQPTGEENMVELAGYIAEGAMAFLKAEWKILAIFAVVAAAILAWSGTLVETSSPVIAISFLIGAVFSATAGYLGMSYLGHTHTIAGNDETENLKNFVANLERQLHIINCSNE